MTNNPLFKRIAIIGAGTMGSGIAGQIANAGQSVLLLDLPQQENPNATASLAVTRL
ncbi:MAG: NAD(P)-binding domain-containing protein, partial [Proteobacteria bacterium]|nr:NAD(P)-binding domain-containing protein [Pseudomonadota bacterium]